MRALTIQPGRPGSLSLTDLPDPRPAEGELLVDALAVGVCGTDQELLDGSAGEPPAGETHLVVGHESLGRVRTAAADSGFEEGDLVAGVVRRPDPVPCPACGHGEFDMCRNGRYVERGIKGSHGYACEQWVVPAEYAVKVDPALRTVGVLLEPTSIVVKAWEQVERIGGRSYFDPRRVLVTGAGPLGLLAALLGRRRGLDVHVLDQVTEGPKPDLVRALGATYHHDLDDAFSTDPEVVIEATGAPPVVLEALRRTTAYGIVCLTGVADPSRQEVDAGSVNNDLVMRNAVVVGSVNANQRHYREASTALAGADLAWLERVVSRRVPLEAYADAFDVRDDDVKVVLTLD